MPVRGAIIVMLVLAFIVAFIPLWQMGASSSGPAVTASEVSVEDSPAAYRALSKLSALGYNPVYAEKRYKKL